LKEIKYLKKFVNYLQPKFSHIYIEKKAYGYPLADTIINKFSNSSIVDINNYKDVFNRPRQDFQTQKKSMNIILAKKNPPFLYHVTDMVQGHNIPRFFYTTPMLNCLYNCEYCFLQGMYSSGNIVIFVNQNDLQDAVKEELNQNIVSKGVVTVSISYNTDLMAMENLFPITKNWIEFASKARNLILEIRTKSSNYGLIKSIVPNNNVVLSWTISPEEISNSYEHLAPPLSQRILAIQSAIDKGWRVRLCFDPVMNIENWDKIYSEFFLYLFQKINTKKLYDVTMGTFRMNKDYFNRIKRRNPESEIYYSEYVTEKNTIALPKNIRNHMMGRLKEELSKYVLSKKILVWD
tara:strand:- start:1743 stop:2789 length:1047 start_codon:yes stop_codon:yes gene_type:complete